MPTFYLRDRFPNQGKASPSSDKVQVVANKTHNWTEQSLFYFINITVTHYSTNDYEYFYI